MPPRWEGGAPAPGRPERGQRAGPTAPQSSGRACAPSPERHLQAALRLWPAPHSGAPEMQHPVRVPPGDVLPFPHPGTQGAGLAGDGSQGSLRPGGYVTVRWDWVLCVWGASPPKTGLPSGPARHHTAAPAGGFVPDRPFRDFPCSSLFIPLNTETAGEPSPVKLPCIFRATGSFLFLETYSELRESQRWRSCWVTPFWVKK